MVTPEDAPVVPARFELVEKLGEGFSGAVYRARDAEGGGDVALKVFDPARVEGRARERFRREAALLAEHRHPALVPLRAAGLDDEPPWMAFRYMEGGDLARHVKKKRLLPREDVLAAGARVASALGFLHERGILHRDLKPANVLRDAAGAAYLGDLGLGKVQGAEGEGMRLTLSGQAVGTWVYMAPEVQRGDSATRASDVYSFAAMMIQLLCGDLPRVSARGVRLPDAFLDAGHPTLLVKRLRQCLRTSPEDRPEDVGVLAGVLGG